ncbi:DUF4190 domain-containing protein [Streptomyces sp. NBC_01304]|uniref:DUF4190 domain-containing protein n=1 Tax=Streptomyces sp. NBC_01304 TaxID=2903818 RepID=UPI002E1428AE|nr:DUF4190 domain-containing protein [Streptomyces sp. NBC_01304]
MSTTPPPFSSRSSPPDEAPQAPPPILGRPAAAPGYGYGWEPAPCPPQARNGFGVTALVLGNIGALLSFIPFTFWLGAPLGALALIFGLMGVSQARKGVADNKGSAVAGSILGGAAIVIAAIWLVIGIAAFSDAADESGGTTESTAPADPGDVYETPAPLKFGQTHTYDDGVTITVSKPKPFTPDESAGGHTKGNAAVQVKITIFNGSDKAMGVALPE